MPVMTLQLSAQTKMSAPTEWTTLKVRVSDGDEREWVLEKLSFSIGVGNKYIFSAMFVCNSPPNSADMRIIRDETEIDSKLPLDAAEKEVLTKRAREWHEHVSFNAHVKVVREESVD